MGFRVNQLPRTNVSQEAEILRHNRKAVYASNLESEKKKENKKVGRPIRVRGLANRGKKVDGMSKQHAIDI